MREGSPALAGIDPQVGEQAPADGRFPRARGDRPAACGGHPTSEHMEGTATDIVVVGVPPHEVARIADEMRFPGLGRYGFPRARGDRPDSTTRSGSLSRAVRPSPSIS